MQQNQIVRDARRQESVLPLCAGQQLALRVLRCAGGAQPYCMFWHGEGSRTGGELGEITALFAPLLQTPPALAYMRSVQLMPPGCSGLTKDERRLLNIIAAAQAGDESLADNYLYRLALERRARHCLGTACLRLAAWLAVNDYWFPCPGDAAPLLVPAGALIVARRQGLYSEDFTVAWPQA